MPGGAHLRPVPPPRVRVPPLCALKALCAPPARPRGAAGDWPAAQQGVAVDPLLEEEGDDDRARARGGVDDQAAGEVLHPQHGEKTVHVPDSGGEK